LISKYFWIGIISISVVFSATLTVSSAAFARTLTVQSIFLNPSGDNATALNGTKYILEGTDEEIASQYYKLGEEFDKKTGIKKGDPVTFMYKNESVTIPYTGEYKNPAADELLDKVLVPIGKPGDDICWLYGEDLQMHFVC
jgi:hypothetical protein